MRSPKEKGPSDDRERTLASLMQAVVETRSRMARARERLRSLEEKIKKMQRADYQSQRDKALGEFIEAQVRAKVARTQLIKQLRGGSA